MPTLEKIIEKMKNQPNGIKISEADKVLTAKGYILIRQKGSHRSYRNKSGDVIVLVDTTPMKAVYIKDILSRVGG